MSGAARVLDIGTSPLRSVSLDDLKVNEALGYRVHPYADAFPTMGGEEFDQLVEDIRSNGQQDAIEYILHGDEKIIVDGRTRLRACIVAKVEPILSKCFAKSDALLGYVWSKNLHRRHLTPSQRAAIVLEQEAFVGGIVEANAERRKATQGRPKKGTKKTKAAGGPSLSTAEALGKAAGVGKTTIKDARVVKDSDKEAFEQLKAGTVSVKAASTKARKKSSIKKTPTKKAATKNPAKKSATKTRRRRDPNSPEAVADKLVGRHDRQWCLGLVVAINDRLSEKA